METQVENQAAVLKGIPSCLKFSHSHKCPHPNPTASWDFQKTYKSASLIFASIFQSTTGAENVAMELELNKTMHFGVKSQTFSTETGPGPSSSTPTCLPIYNTTFTWNNAAQDQASGTAEERGNSKHCRPMFSTDAT